MYVYREYWELTDLEANIVLFSTIFENFCYLLICRLHCCIRAKVETFRISLQFIYFVTI